MAARHTQFIPNAALSKLAAMGVEPGSVKTLEEAPRPIRVKRNPGSWRQTLASSLTAAMATMWFGATLFSVLPDEWTFDIPRIAKNEAADAGPTLHASASVADRLSFVRVPHLGLIHADSPLLHLPSDFIEEIGIVLTVASSGTQEMIL